MRILGIDPGITGGLSVVEISDGAAPTLVACIDIPVVGGGAKERVDVAAIRNFIEEHKPAHALIERAGAMQIGPVYCQAVLAHDQRRNRSTQKRKIWRPSSWRHLRHVTP